jgi:hypothetical protein
MSSEICNFISIKDQYTLNIGKINITTNKFDIYLNDKLTKKDNINIKITTNDLIEIINYINDNNKYVIHIINIVYNSSPSDNVSYLNYCKTIIIDNCGNVYVGCIILTSICPTMAKSFKNVKIEYPDKIKSDPLPDFLILLIKNIHDNFIFRSIDYTVNIIDTIKSITNVAYFNTEFRQEYNKHNHHKKSLQNIIDDLEQENMLYFSTLKDAADENTELTDQLFKINNDNLIIKSELDKYKNNYLIILIMYIWSIIKFLLFIK